MAGADYFTLFERIRRYCREQEWYGPSMLGPGHFFDRGLAEAGAMSRFVYPPATEQQLLSTERMLGFKLPATLRALYANVANGGFGPGYGITGAHGGAPHGGGWSTDIGDGYINGRPPNIRWVDFAVLSSAQQAGKWFELRQDSPDQDWFEWPEYLIGFCYWGCNTQHAIHAKSGQIYVVESGFNFALWAPSLEVWLEQWLDGMLKQE